MAGFRRLSIALVICALTLSLSIETWAQTPKRIREHEVQREETVYSIARRYNASIEKIYELNPWAKKQTNSLYQQIAVHNKQVEAPPQKPRDTR